MVLRDGILWSLFIGLLSVVRVGCQITHSPPRINIYLDGEPFNLTCEGVFPENTISGFFFLDDKQSSTLVSRGNPLGDVSRVVERINGSNLFYHTLTLSGLASTANQVFIFCGILHLDDFSPIRLTDLSQLILAVEPEVMVKTSVVVEEESATTLVCNATGIPLPDLEWWYNGMMLKAMSNTTKLELPLPDVRRAQAGEYECRSSNMAGNASKSTELTVYYAPRIHTISQSVLLPVGNRLLLRCIASGVPAPRVTWVHHRHNLSVVPHLVLSHGRDIATGGVAGEANVTSAAVLAGDEGQYTCIARNVIAHHRQHLMVTLQFRPDAPEFDPHIVSDQTNVYLKWSMPDYHNSSIVKYEIEQRSADNNTWILLPENTGSLSSLTYTASGLEPYTEYEFRIRAENGIGLSDYGNTTGLVRTQPTPPIPPDAVSVIVTKPTDVVFLWQFPQAWTRSMGTLRNIIVEFRTLDSDTFTSREYDVDEGTTDGVVTLDKLQKGTAYHLRIYSGNEQFRGGYVTVFVNTSTTVPGNATSFKAIVLSHERIRFVWTGIDDGGTPLTKVNLYYQVDTGAASTSWEQFEAINQPPPLTDYVLNVSGFTPETTYRFRLSARNKNGRGRRTFSNTVTTPEYQFPPHVTSIKARESAIMVRLQWNLTNYAPLVPISLYELNWRIVGQLDWEEELITPQPGVFSSRLGNLRTDTQYELRMRTHNEYNTSMAYSESIVIRTKTGLPKRPMELRLVENKPNHLRLEWRIDSSDEFPANELRFRITRVTESVADLPDRTVTGIIHSSGQFLLDKLLPRTKYILRVYSINQHGTSLHSIDREFTTEDLPPTTPPTSVTNTGQEKTSSNSNLTIIIAAACGGGLVLLMLIIIIVIFVKRQKTTHDGWNVGTEAPSPRKGAGIPEWYNNGKRGPSSPIAEKDGSFPGLARGNSTQQSLKSSNPNDYSQPEMYETDQDRHPGGAEPTTFTSFSLAKQPAMQQSMSIDEEVPPPPSSPPRTPPESPPATPTIQLSQDRGSCAAALSPPQYSSSPIVPKKSQMSDDQDLSHINQTNTFAPLSSQQATINTNV